MPYQIISAKTSILFTRLFGGSADGMNATGEGDRKDFYDTIRNIQSSIKPQLLTAYGIMGGLSDGKFKTYEDYEFANLEAPDEKEKAENLKSIAEVAEKLISLGGKAEDVFDWVKGFKEYNLDKIQLDTDTEGLEDYGNNPNDITTDIMAEYQRVGNAEFKETDHPRKDNGQFGCGSNATSGVLEKSVEKSDKYNIVGIDLPKEEYGKVLHELNNNLSKEERSKKTITKCIGEYRYTVKNNGFNEYVIISKKGIGDDYF